MALISTESKTLGLPIHGSQLTHLTVYSAKVNKPNWKESATVNFLQCFPKPQLLKGLFLGETNSRAVLPGEQAQWTTRLRQRAAMSGFSWCPASSGFASEGGDCWGCPWNAAYASRSDSSIWSRSTEQKKKKTFIAAERNVKHPNNKTFTLSLQKNGPGSRLHDWQMASSRYGSIWT